MWRADQAGLYHDPDLQLTLSWKKTSAPTAAWGARYHEGYDLAMRFLDESAEAARAEEAEHKAARRRELEQAQKLAETERARAEEQAAAVGRLRRQAVWLSVLMLLAVIASIWAYRTRKHAEEAAGEAKYSQEQAELSAQDAQREKRRAEQLQSRAVPHRRAIGHHDGVAAAVELGDFSLADA